MFAEYAVCPSQSAVIIPETLDIEKASLTEPASCCLSEPCDETKEAKLGVVIVE